MIIYDGRKIHMPWLIQPLVTPEIDAVFVGEVTDVHRCVLVISSTYRRWLEKLISLISESVPLRSKFKHFLLSDFCSYHPLLQRKLRLAWLENYCIAFWPPSDSRPRDVSTSQRDESSQLRVRVLIEGTYCKADEQKMGTACDITRGTLCKGVRAKGCLPARMVQTKGSDLNSQGSEAQRRKDTSHVHWACSPVLWPLMEVAWGPVIDPTAKAALLSAVVDSHKEGGTWKSLC